MGPILFQLPPRWHLDLDRLTAFLEALPPYHRYSFEFRDPTWHVLEVYELLRRHNIAFCIFELAGFQSPVELTADFTYVRLHGPGGAYRGDYQRRSLDAWARRVCGWASELKHAYVYFDNDEAAFAAHNALELKEIVKTCEV